MTRSDTRLIVAVVLCLALIAVPVFAAGRQEQPAKENVTITFSFGLDPGGAFEEIARVYSARTPGVTVQTLQLPPTPNQQFDRYVTTFASQDSNIDVLLMDIIWVAQFAAAGWIAPLEGQIDMQITKPLLEGPLNANRYRGNLYGLPFFTDTGMLYYRKDLLEKYGFTYPKTWEELVTQSRTIIDGERNPNLSGLVFQAAQIEGITINFLEFFHGAGGFFLNEKGEYVFEKEYAKEARKALQFMYDMIYTHRVAPVAVTTSNPNDNRISFEQGNAIFMRNWPFAYTSAQETDLAGKVGIAPIPHFEGNPNTVTANLGGWQLAMNAYTDTPKEALAFLQWAVSEEAQRILVEKAGQFPAYAPLYEDPAIQELNPLYGQILDVLESTFPRPVTEFYTEVSSKMQPELNGALTRVKSVERALADMFAGISEVLDN
ncbi:MAG: ABC transporter substrate-binding protein [Spirochaetia bacterium]|nr:ABC transporter substrate-binding protein [Spirochaetia bacterium]